MPEKARKEDLEANHCHVEFPRSSRNKHWQAGLLLASVLAATALLFAVIGLVTGLGVVRSDESQSDGCSVDVAGDPTTVVSASGRARACRLAS